MTRTRRPSPGFGRSLVTWGAAPALLYAAFFFVFTYPAVWDFSTSFYADSGDGLTNVWSIWWVKTAVIEHHQSPWQTDYIHYPFGLSLHLTTLNAFNGLFGIPLSGFLNLVETHNTIVVFSFVATGLTACWLAREVTGSYVGSLLAGFVFTFSEYHFAHAEGHLNLVSVEWLPLAVLFFMRIARHPSVWRGVMAALAAFGLYLCDYYYFLYLAVMWCLLLLWQGIERRDLLFWARREHRSAYAAWAATVTLTAGPMAGRLAWIAWTDPLVGSHAPEEFSLDFLALFVPGGHWRFGELTEGYWSKLPGNIHESSVFLGYSVLTLLAIAWVKRRSLALPSLPFWYAVLGIFFVLALGPRLRIAGTPIERVPMPYAWVNTVAPFLALGGVPVRMVVMVLLCASVVSAAAVVAIQRATPHYRAILTALIAVMMLEYWPAALTVTAMDTPDYVTALSQQADGAFIDARSEPEIGGPQLYYQTIHHKQMAFGFSARLTESLLESEAELRAALDERAYATIRCRYRFRYILTDDDVDVDEAALISGSEDVKLFDLGSPLECRGVRDGAGASAPAAVDRRTDDARTDSRERWEAGRSAGPR